MSPIHGIVSEKLALKNSKLFNECISSITFFSYPAIFQFSLAAISFVIACLCFSSLFLSTQKSTAMMQNILDFFLEFSFVQATQTNSKLDFAEQNTNIFSANPNNTYTLQLLTNWEYFTWTSRLFYLCFWLVSTDR